MIELIKINKIFNHNNKAIVALKEVSFAVEKGSFVSVIGPSGCGKTTLLKIMGALVNPSKGIIMINGQSSRKALSQHSFGFVFQDPTLLPWRTVVGNIQLPAEILKDSAARARVAQLIQLVGLEGFEDSFPRELSGGMKTRVAIARALSFHPSIILMDEPFGSLDELTRDVMNFELLRIWKETKTTVVFVTHNINEAVLLSDKIVILTARPGTIKEIINVDLSRPRVNDLRRTAQFVGLVEGIRNKLIGGNGNG